MANRKRKRTVPESTQSSDSFTRNAAPVLGMAVKRLSKTLSATDDQADGVRLALWEGDELFDRWSERERNRRTNAVFALLCGLVEQG
jgi:prolyl-tRNA editing enzyme YbaK/EbsC (Cys-tRNA(Pro) deacylase)